MKKVLFPLFAAALLFTLAGCHGKDNDLIPEFPDPSTKEQAMSIQFDKGKFLELEMPRRENPSDPGSIKNDEIVKIKIPVIDLSEDSRYVLYCDEILTKADGKKFASVWTGRYTFDKSKGVFELEGFAKIEVDDKNGKVVVSPVLTKASYGTPVTLDASIFRFETATAIAANLSRSWRITSTWVSIKGGKNDVNVSKGFDGCDFYSMAQFFKTKKVSISDSRLAELEGYKVQEMLLEGNNSIIITFDAKDPYYGAWTLNGTNFTWSFNDSNFLLTSRANGSVRFPKNGQTELDMTMMITAGDESYTARIVFALEQVN